MDKILDSYGHQNWTKMILAHYVLHITHNEIEAAINSFLKKKSTGPNWFSAKFYQTLLLS
jgi:hypothetical protein